ncbi:type I polyketide synthase [Frankia sp. Mgl5]|uniref:type I polyketide synthase n=1 Tax=Frankia sp. Mgl5 TaxID=2933793 RepID=UPI00200F86F8|nr:type I polyketide synthase [Frankia sp. Mgl5]MCK9926355.1 type I polyketide synthase [Frankia sp. Mgl5]
MSSDGNGALESETSAVAVIGLACRLPRAENPGAFWRLLENGESAITPIPETRASILSTEARHGAAARPAGYLDAVDTFDPEFFGISPREAAAMDPQQRLVLELSWEALEDAGIVPGTLTGTRTGVFLGAIAHDYATLTHRRGPDAITRHTLTGLNHGILANRVSYTLGLRGPSLTVDAAQASALVAVHLALTSIRRGETDLALVGGVNLNLAPESTLTVERFGALSPDGRCFTFDARANGYVRGEGGGIVVLKPLADALADGDPVTCVLRGSAVTNDGATDALTVPSSDAQRDAVRRAFADAGIDPAAAQYVELHGTGTPVGDPLEAAALGAGRPSERALLVGSAKTNVGHLEGAAGIVGLLKTALAIRHRRIPASLNFEHPNPDIPLAELRLRVASSAGAWPRPAEALVAGVSSFGVGGTNCHVVLTEAPPGAEPPAPGAGVPDGQDTGAVDAPVLAWVLSARTPQALRDQAHQLTTHLDHHPHTDPTDLAHTLATTRTHFPHRAVILGTTTTDLHPALTALTALTHNQPHPALTTTPPTSSTGTGTGKTVFVFPGQGTQWPAMARELLTTNPVFTHHIHACADALHPHTTWNLLDVLHQTPNAPTLDRVDVVQPTLFAVMTSLARLWQHHGIHPHAVIGHSQGEITAAHIADALTLTDAAKIVTLRAQALRHLAGTGTMISIPLPAHQINTALAEWRGRLDIAAANGPTATVISAGVAGQPEVAQTSGSVAGGRETEPRPGTAASNARV